MTEQETIKLAVSLYNKTIGSEIEPLAYDDIPKKLAEILSTCLGKNVEVSGDGLKDDIVCRF